MSVNVINQSPYLRTSRDFPKEINELTVELSKTYIDTANIANARTIGLFPIIKPAINGESWFILNNQRQQGLRQVYNFTSTADIDIGFKFSSIDRFVRCWGEYSDGTNWYGIINGTSVAITGQISFYIALNGASTTSDVIKFLIGAGAPVLSSGIIVLEWISLP